VAATLKAQRVLVGTVTYRFPAFATWANATADAGGDADADAAVAKVRIASPHERDVVATPVTFVVTASAEIAKVRLLAETTLLGEVDLATTSRLVRPFTQVGPRVIHAVGIDDTGKAVAEDSIAITVVDELKLNHTFFWVALQGEHDAGTSKTLYTESPCAPLQHAGADVKISDDFFAELCMEGTGRLTDGTTINVTSRDCSCALEPYCPIPNGQTVAYRKCWRILPATMPWGEGSRSNPLVPLVSWATDTTKIASGTILYAPAWDGVVVNGVDGSAQTLDGCFRSDDVGQMINATHIDFFAGTRAVYEQLNAVHPTQSTDWMWAQLNHPKCHPATTP
jgi:hypothetical protein